MIQLIDDSVNGSGSNIREVQKVKYEIERRIKKEDLSRGNEWLQDVETHKQR